MPGRQFNSGSYDYGFNGKENDNEVKGTGNQQDYGFRIYDPRLGRFLSIDPLTKSYPWYTPYQFAGNTPVEATDLDGGEPNHNSCDDLLNEQPPKKPMDQFVDWLFNTSLEEKFMDLVGNDLNNVNALIENDPNVSTLDKTTSLVKLNLLVSAPELTETKGTPSKGPKLTDKSKPQIKSTNSAKAEATQEVKAPGPTEPYNRRKHYPGTPSKADRKALGATKDQVVDHNPPLVQQYYDGDGAGGKPGYLMNAQERKAASSDRSKMKLQSKDESNKQGGKMAQYSKKKKKENGL